MKACQIKAVYQIIIAKDLEEFHIAVETRLNDDYQLAGGLVLSDGYYLQAVYKPSSIDIR